MKNETPDVSEGGTERKRSSFRSRAILRRENEKSLYALMHYSFPFRSWIPPFRRFCISADIRRTHATCTTIQDVCAPEGNTYQFVRM